MFFTSGLLHWVRQSLRLVPPDINVVLLGSALAPEELDWARSFARPFHSIELDVDDKTVWEFLFATNRYNFGWLDIDCFVLNPALFYEMVRLAPDSLGNCVFSFASGRDVDVLLTYFLFLNVEAIRAVTARVPVSPCTYTYHRSRAGRKAAYAFAKVLTPEILEILARVIPLDEEGKPHFFSETRYFDTLQVYQVVAQVLGYKLHKVRSLSWAPSEEAVHIGKASYYRKRWNDPDSPQKREAYARLLQTEYLLLTGAGEELPVRYSELRDELARELAERGLSGEPEEILQNLQGIASDVGLSGGAFSRLFHYRHDS